MLYDKSVIFDLDDVIVKGSFLEILKEFLQKEGEELTDLDISNVCSKCYYTEKELIKDEAMLKRFYKYLLSVNIYDYGVVDEKAVAFIKKLSSVCKVFIATSPIIGDSKTYIGEMYKMKYDFYTKTFPFLDPANLIICGNKSVLSAKYIIDDRLDNLSENCNIRILYTAKHNEHYSLKSLYQKQVFRISDIDELEKCILGNYSLVEMKKIIQELFKALYVTKYFSITIKAVVDGYEKKMLEIYINEKIDADDKILMEKYLEKRLGQDKVSVIYGN